METCEANESETNGLTVVYANVKLGSNGKPVTIDRHPTQGFLLPSPIIVYELPIAVKHGVLNGVFGEVEQRMYGVDFLADYLFVVDDPKFPIREDARIFIDKIFVTDEFGTPLSNFKVKGIRSSLNHKVYSFEKERASGAV